MDFHQPRLRGGLNTYGYALQNPVNYVDVNGDTPAHAVRLAFYGGTRIGVGINYGIQAATGLSLGILLYEAFNEGIDFGDAANDDDFCPPKEPCERAREALNVNRTVIKKIGRSKSPGAIAQYNTAARSFNRLVEPHNTKCPNHQVEKLPLFGPGSVPDLS